MWLLQILFLISSPPLPPKKNHHHHHHYHHHHHHHSIFLLIITSKSVFVSPFPTTLQCAPLPLPILQVTKFLFHNFSCFFFIYFFFWVRTLIRTLKFTNNYWMHQSLTKGYYFSLAISIHLELIVE